MATNYEKELLDKADNAYYSGNYAQAIEIYKQVLDLNPNNERAAQQLKKAQSKLAFQTDRERRPIEATRAFARARSCVGAQDFALAILNLEVAIETTKAVGASFPEAEELLLAVRDIIKFKNWKVFLSYSKKDIDVAKVIYQFLDDNRCNVWMDIFDLVPGQDWKLEISKNIRSSNFFLACLSNNSVSKSGYVQKELKEAISILDEMPEGEIFIIPIRIDDCSVPSYLADKQWLDWSAPNAKEMLLRVLKPKK